MDTSYIKKESVIRKCIDEGEKYYSSYQMQVIKSKFYTAITFDKSSDDYKKRIDEVYNYAKEILAKKIEKLKEAKAKADRIIKENKIHVYINEKEKNTSERVLAFKDRTPQPPKYKKNDEDFKEVNSIYDVREKLLSTNDVYSLFGEDYLDMGLYIKTMIDHAITNYIARDYLNAKHPRYIETRHELFEYIASEIQNPEVNINAFLSNILNNETLLRQFMYEVNPYYLDKLSNDYKIIKENADKQRESSNPTLNFIETSISNMDLNDETINSLLNNKKTL